ncbi:MAG: T9SS type A sorting domain-containing protein [Calditrichia bacterium]
MRLKIYLMLIALGLSIWTPLLAKDDKKVSNRGAQKLILGDQVIMNINNIDLPMENDGSNGNDGEGHYPNGTDLVFLFQGGIAASAKVNGELRASWMARASLIQEYQPGPWGTDPSAAESKFYTANDGDSPGSANHLAWADAVAQGADFQDIDGNGVYDPNVDRPDVIGDKTFWAVYNDNTSLSTRTPRLQTDPIGLEVRQTAWAFARGDALGDVVFIRYRFVNKNEVPIDSLVFTIWTDPDLGDFEDDLIGSDVDRSMGYIYNDGDDANYGLNPPAFGVDFFQGPIVPSPGDQALLYKGPFFGIDTVQDFRNLPLTSFTFYINGDPQLGDPTTAEIARFYQLGGLDAQGVPIVPTAWGVGSDATTDNRFFYSGNPEDGTGWLDNAPGDKRFMVNTGPFTLLPGEDNTQDIVVAYVVSQGSDQLDAVRQLRLKDDIAQLAYNANFIIAGPPPTPVVQVRTDDQEIELLIDLEENGTLAYEATDELFNRQVFEGVRIVQYRSPRVTDDVVKGVENIRELTILDLDNEYGPIFLRNADGTWSKVFEGNNNLDANDFQVDGSGIITYRITSDGFTGEPLVNGQEYYFSVTAFSVNPPFLNPDVGGVITGSENNWLASSEADFLENAAATNLYTAVPQSDETSPFRSSFADYSGTRSLSSDAVRGQVFVDVIDQSALTGAEYTVEFESDGDLWSLFRTDGGGRTLLSDSLAFQSLNDPSTDPAYNFPVVDGLSIQVYNVPDGIANVTVTTPDQVTLADTTLANPDPWIVSQANLDSSAGFDLGINLSRIDSPTRSTTTRDSYFPVRLEFLTDATETGYRWFLSNFANDNFFRGPDSIALRAFDMSNPDSPRRLNIAFNNSINGLPFNSINDIYIMETDYDPANAYVVPGATDAFKTETYLQLSVEAAGDFVRDFPITMDVTPNYPNSDVDAYRINSGLLAPDLSSGERADLLEAVKAVPNPYFAGSSYETSTDTPIMRFTHLDNVVTIRIFNIAGQLVRTLNKDDSSNELRWDLRNEAGLRVASGMYIAHIEVAGVGEKVLKLGVVQREERIDRF